MVLEQCRVLGDMMKMLLPSNLFFSYLLSICSRCYSFCTHNAKAPSGTTPLALSSPFAKSFALKMLNKIFFSIAILTFLLAHFVSAQSFQGGVFIAQPGKVVFLGPDITVQKTYSSLDNPFALKATDHTLWIAEKDGNRVSQYTFRAELINSFQTQRFRHPTALSPSADKGVWVAYADYVVKLNAEAKEELRISGFALPQDLAVTKKQDIWVADTANKRLVKINKEGQELISLSPYVITSIAYNAQEDALWILRNDRDAVAKITSDGTELFTVKGFFSPSRVALCDRDGSVWVTDTSHNEVVHLSSAGDILQRITGFRLPKIADSYLDKRGKCHLWVADQNNNQLVLLNEEGIEEERLDNYKNVIALATVQGKLPDIETAKINLTELYQKGDIVKVTQEGIVNASLSDEPARDSYQFIPSDISEQEIDIQNTNPREQNNKEEETSPEKIDKSNTFAQRLEAVGIYVGIVLLFGLFLFLLFARKKKI